MHTECPQHGENANSLSVHFKGSRAAALQNLTCRDVNAGDIKPVGFDFLPMMLPVVEEDLGQVYVAR
jgi:hypothetical protein